MAFLQREIGGKSSTCMVPPWVISATIDAIAALDAFAMMVSSNVY